VITPGSPSFPDSSRQTALCVSLADRTLSPAAREVCRNSNANLISPGSVARKSAQQAYIAFSAWGKLKTAPSPAGRAVSQRVDRLRPFVNSDGFKPLYVCDSHVRFEWKIRTQHGFRATHFSSVEADGSPPESVIHFDGVSGARIIGKPSGRLFSPDRIRVSKPIGEPTCLHTSGHIIVAAMYLAHPTPLVPHPIQ